MVLIASHIGPDFIVPICDMHEESLHRRNIYYSQNKRVERKVDIIGENSIV